MGKTARVVINLALSVLTICLAVSLAAGVILSEAALHPARRPIADRAKYGAEAMHEANASLQDVSITATDGSVLKAWYVRPSIFSGSSVILLHGVADNREGVSGYAWMFLRHNYAVLMPDSRAHGQSAGNIATYGVLERNDVSSWARWLKTRTPDCEYLFGESMGAAIAVQSATKISSLCAIAVEDSFESFREIAYDRIAQQTGIPEPWARVLGRPAIEGGLLYARLRYGVRLSRANPLLAEAHSHTPTLLITGTADSNIPMRHSIALSHAARDHTTLWVVDGAEHTGAMQVNPLEFENRITKWFNTHQTAIENRITSPTHPAAYYGPESHP